MEELNFDINDLIGMHLDSAKAWLDTCRVRYRVTRRGKQAYIITMDYVSSRLNLKADESDIVTEVTFG